MEHHESAIPGANVFDHPGLQNCAAGSPEDIELTILMPCLNEARTVGICIAKALSYMERNQIKGEVVVADNGSSDGSQSIAAAAGARVVPVSRKGYGAALLGGIAAAKGRYVIMGDADDSYDFSSLNAFVAKLRAGFQIVMGNRFLGGIEEGAMPFLNRYLGNPVLSFIGRLFFSSDIRDFHCGLRGFSREAVLRLNLDTPGMEFASEMIVKAVLAKLSICEVATKLNKDGRDRPPHLRRWSDGWRHLRFLLLFAPRQLFLYPGAVLLLVGIVLGGLLLTGSMRIGGVTLDTSSLLFMACMIMMGTQLTLFYSTAQAISDSVVSKMSTDGIVKRRGHHLEGRLILGGAVFMIGALLAVGSVIYWGTADFHKLDPSRILRITIPAATTMVVGLQIVFTAFLHSVLLITGKIE
ncbi:glycosyltransferase family 2 protein [Burkholderia sp. F1]|uniref:glycosyltransferase family 2 protein n=1 Tax=Burkholderia sp. F1 TaxID=3366817 RepID=UPI003D73E77E